MKQKFKTQYYLHSKKMKYGIHLTKHIQDLYAENSKMLVREIKEDLNKWTDTCIMFMDWNIHYSKDVNFPQIDLQV